MGLRPVVVTFGTCFKHVTSSSFFFLFRHVIEASGHCLLIVQF
jgi:hypothetical protein